MQETLDEIYKIQHDIFMKKPLKERFLLNLDLTEFVREMTKRRILKANPGISKKELKAEIFKRNLYRYFFRRRNKKDNIEILI